MKIAVYNGPIEDASADTLVVDLFKDAKEVSGAAAAVDKKLKGRISKFIKAKEISGRLGDAFLLYTHGMIPAKRVIVVGLGDREKFSLDAIRKASAAAIRAARSNKAEKISSIVHGAGTGGIEPALAAQAMVEGSILADYKFDGYAKEKKDEKVKIKSFTIAEIDKKKLKAFKEGSRVGEILANCQNRARDMVNTPSNKMTPRIFAEHARKEARKFGLLCTVIDPKKDGMESINAIAMGSLEPARLVVLSYRHSPRAETVALIGKGITFDSGGISIKPSSKMWEMKTDMAGAAAVLEAMCAIAQLKLKKNIMAVIPLTENMPSGGALKPGDVVGSLSGITTEVISTDAEGRMILADAITYAKKKGAHKIIDCATLTGGCIIALGDAASGLLGNDDDLIKSMEDAAEISGEKVWHLPLFDEYEDYLKSSIADHKNCTEGGRGASASTGAMYLKKYVGDTPWVHFDIAGTAYLSKAQGALSEGATGVPMRTIIEYLRK